MEKELTALLTSLKNELKKEYILVDGQGRGEFYFQAPINTGNNQPCLVTQIEYASPTSTLVIKSKETIGVWLDAYNI